MASINPNGPGTSSQHKPQRERRLCNACFHSHYDSKQL
jgi:hypothetical protein